MYPNPIFHDADTRQNLDFAAARGFGVLAINSSEGPLLSHVPFLLDTAGATVDLHLVRSNPIARSLKTETPARIAVSGPDSYISPDWYGVPDQVPTWNYVAVQLTGTLSLLPQDEMRAMLDRQSKDYEGRLSPKAPWKTNKMTPEVLDKMMRMIVPCRMVLTAVDGTWKLSQNKPDEVRLRAAAHVAKADFGNQAERIAALMTGDR